MAGQRKTLGSLVTSAPPAPPAPSLSSPDRTDRPDRTAAPPSPEASARLAAAGDMAMRSWYKHLIMGAVVNVLDRHRAEVEAEARAAGGAAGE